jgi:hypothetical protein
VKAPVGRAVLKVKDRQLVLPDIPTLNTEMIRPVR